jgi:[ribosomal protein S5]-alanine N-acetyltransferase
MNASDDFPSIETARLLLRPLAAGDLDFVFQHFSDPKVGRYLVDEEPLTTWAQAQEIVDFYVSPGARTYNRWVIVRKLDGQAIGTCGFHRWSKQHNHAEVGYDLTPPAWGQGIMTEAMTAVRDHGFARLKLNRIEALVHPDNAPSIRLLERLGFQKEGLLRQYCRQGDMYHDTWLLSLLRTERV